MVIFFQMYWCFVCIWTHNEQCANIYKAHCIKFKYSKLFFWRHRFPSYAYAPPPMRMDIYNPLKIYRIKKYVLYFCYDNSALDLIKHNVCGVLVYANQMHRQEILIILTLIMVQCSYFKSLLVTWLRCDLVIFADL